MYMLIWYFSNNLDIYYYVGKLLKQHFSVWLFTNPGDKILFLLKFDEARISEWNISQRGGRSEKVEMLALLDVVLAILCIFSNI